MIGERMKVLQVGKFYPPHMGGIETHVQVLCRELQKRVNVEVLVASETKDDEEFWDDRVKVTRVGTRLKLSGAPLCPGLSSKIRRAKADIVHLHLPNPPAILSYLASGHRGQVIATYHSDIVRQQFLAKAFDPILRLFLRKCAAIIATSEKYVETSPVLSDYVDRCRIIPYGIPIKQFSAYDSGEIARIRKQFGPRLIISVGRLIYYKGFMHLVDAMRNIDGHLLIVGEGHLREDLESRARANKVSHKITFLGEVLNDDIVPYYHAADVFALASIARSEAFGIVQLEAMACGKPVVNTDLDSGVPCVSLHDKTGLTVPPNDPVALAGAINKLLEDPELREAYGRAARDRVDDEFDQDVMLERMVELYSQVLSLPIGEKSQSVQPFHPKTSSSAELGSSSFFLSSADANRLRQK
jgi:glycosyltransferase involved in cell wall biosynthesis